MPPINGLEDSLGTTFSIGISSLRDGPKQAKEPRVWRQFHRSLDQSFFQFVGHLFSNCHYLFLRPSRYRWAVTFAGRRATYQRCGNQQHPKDSLLLAPFELVVFLRGANK
jgi:hypothetical protein